MSDMEQQVIANLAYDVLRLTDKNAVLTAHHESLARKIASLTAENEALSIENKALASDVQALVAEIARMRGVHTPGQGTP